ncbi:MAG TPA: shikimate kinase [Clostridiaceae bacterium]|nr:shikimate kinase [Clostridiaceae bacterium]
MQQQQHHSNRGEKKSDGGTKGAHRHFRERKQSASPQQQNRNMSRGRRQQDKQSFGQSNRLGNGRQRRQKPRRRGRRRAPLSHDNLVLIGMPGSGKSTLGRRTANILGLSFVDTDRVLNRQTKMSTGDLAKKAGPEGFMKAETKAVCSVRPRKRIVVATGGSVIYSDRCMKHLKQLGIVVYIELPLHILERRLGDLKKRGVVLKEGQTLKDLYEERTKLYEKYADVTFSPYYSKPAESARYLAAFYNFMVADESLLD